MGAQDVRLQQSQRVLATTAMPVLHILNELSSLKAGDTLQASDIQSLTTHASNILTLLSHQNHRLLQERKNKIVRTLTPDLKSLRNVSEPDSNYLFGTDLVTKVQNIKKGHQAFTKPSFPNLRPYQRHRFTKREPPYQRKNFRPFPTNKPPWKGKTGETFTKRGGK